MVEKLMSFLDFVVRNSRMFICCLNLTWITTIALSIIFIFILDNDFYINCEFLSYLFNKPLLLSNKDNTMNLIVLYFNNSLLILNVIFLVCVILLYLSKYFCINDTSVPIKEFLYKIKCVIGMVDISKAEWVLSIVIISSITFISLIQNKVYVSALNCAEIKSISDKSLFPNINNFKTIEILFDEIAKRSNINLILYDYNNNEFISFEKFREKRYIKILEKNNDYKPVFGFDMNKFVH